MNARQLQYAILLSETGNFSLVAEKLNISQPALSKQILSLEKELGVQLFNRNNSPSILTPAGEHFIREAKELLYKEKQLIRSLEQFKTGDMGSLSIGITPFRGSYLISDIVKKIRDKYPGIQVKLREVGSDILRKEAAEGKFDFAIINLPVDESLFDITLIEPDRLVLVVPSALAEGEKTLDKGGKLSFSDCKHLPFVVVTPAQEMRKLFDSLCTASGVMPEIAAEVTGLVTAWEMACAGIGATLLPYQFVKNKHPDGSVTVFELKDASYLRQPAIVTLKRQYVSEYAKYAIELLTKL